MSLNLAILKEQNENERRVAAIPETVKKLIAAGCSVSVEKGAGLSASYSDEAYKDAGAKLSTAADAAKSADILLCVGAPGDGVLKNLKKGALVIGALAPYRNPDIFKSLAAHKLSGFAMELVPRITRAQSMDILSSQANLAGYKAVLDAAEYYSGSFPMMMTAAGTVPPAKVFVMGAGVAGLQAIATAKRLGAVVSATDVRPAAKEQVQSLGGTFVAVEDDEFKQAETAGGYAKEMSKDYQKKQQALVEDTIQKQDIVITTALIPGRAAPVLVTEEMVKSMKPGAVIVDLAVEQGGNCTLSENGKVVVKHGVTIIGHKNVPSRLATVSSALYARNLLNFVQILIDKDSKTLAVNWEDDIIKGTALTKDGAVIHPLFGKDKPAAAKTAAAKKKAANKTPAKKPAAKKKAAAKKTTPKKPAAKKAKK